MKKISFVFLSIFSFLFLAQLVISALIKVDVKKELKGDVSSFSFNSFLDVLNYQIEFYNTGSVAYNARVRIDLLNGSELISRSWSDEKILMPGDRKKFEIFSFVNFTGNFTVKLRVYFADEIFEKEFDVEKNETATSREDVFEIKNFRTYENFIIFDLKSRKNVKDVVILPRDFPVGWIFEQKRLTSIEENEEKIIVIKYKPTVFSAKNLTLAIAGEGGLFYTEREAELKKDIGIVWLIHFIIDQVRMLRAN